MLYVGWMDGIDGMVVIGHSSFESPLVPITGLNEAKSILNTILHAYNGVFTEQIIKCFHKNCPRQSSDSSSCESSIVLFLVFVLIFFLVKF